uniref:Alkylglycerone-phosphate synthase n=1 Tax=Arcella intermedia TaxID=1963864 RepID=A0A6B2L0P4_9EUKA
MSATQDDDELDQRATDKLRWNGWGYEDTEFAISQSGDVYLTGQRYSSAGELPSFRGWVETDLGIDLRVVAPSGPFPSHLPEPTKNEPWVKEAEGNYGKISFDPAERLQHSHGHTAQEIFRLRYGWKPEYRIVDAVVYPREHGDVEKLVALCVKHNVVVIPYGGGTSVTYGLSPPDGERRMIISMDMSLMNKVKWVNKKNMTACIEAGLRGILLAEKLEEYGVTMGHEPDSAEFSTFGGWIATRASGMKKNRYGNIEDLLVNAKLVTPIGVIHKEAPVPRVSCGPDINQIILGSEGTLGVITEGIVKIRPLPEHRIFGAIVFPRFEDGVKFMREVAYHRAQPASLRLVDNEQFRFSQALKPKSTAYFQSIADLLKKKYITQWHGFDVNQMAAATLVFEGTKEEVSSQQKIVYAIAKRYNGVKADAKNGKRGYELTFMIAYLRDFAFQVGMISESFETSVPWSNTYALCQRVKERVRAASRLLKVPGEPFTSCRVTQAYDVGSCVYFYIALQFQGLDDPVHVFSEIEHAARDEIFKAGGSISHHHGVGKHRISFVKQAIGETGISTLQTLKNGIDPKNIFANGNLIDPTSK